MRSLTKFSLLLTPLFGSLLCAQEGLPPTPVHEITEDYFGVKVADPYRWLEETSSPAVVSWMKAQNDYTRTVLQRIPGRDKLLERIKALDNAGNVVSALQVWGGRYFYFKTVPGSDNRKLYVRDKPGAPERLLVDPEKLTTADGKHFSIDYFAPSIDGRYVAYGISPGGSEESVLHVIESTTGKVLSDSIDRAEFAQPAWLPDNTFFYTRAQKLAPDAPATAKYQKMRAYHHTCWARMPTRRTRYWGIRRVQRSRLGRMISPGCSIHRELQSTLWRWSFTGSSGKWISTPHRSQIIQTRILPGRKSPMRRMA